LWAVASVCPEMPAEQYFAHETVIASHEDAMF